MNWSKVGRWVLLLGSLVLGLFSGLIGYWIFEAKVPSGMQTAVLSTEAKFYYIGSGLLFGMVIFGWSLVASWIAGRSGASRARRESNPPAAAQSR